MTFTLTAQKLVVYGAAAAVLAGFGAALGWRVVGPGQAIAALAHADTLMASEHVAIFTQIQELNNQQIAVQRIAIAAVDSLRHDLRPLNVFLCLNDRPVNTIMMGLDCETILKYAKGR